MNFEANLKEQICHLKTILSKIQTKSDYHEKCAILDTLPIVENFTKQLNNPPLQKFISQLSNESNYVIKSIVAIGQAPIVFNMCNANQDISNKLLHLLESLLEVEIFYQHIGGVIGYHLTVLQGIVNTIAPSPPSFEKCRYIKPEGLHLSEENSDVHNGVKEGLFHLPNIAMIYPIGGAGDRLNFKDENTQTPLPVALLPFLGRTLLEGLIRDIQAKEYLFFKLFGKHITTPIAIMTSSEKDNHVHVFNICKINQWFGRPQESFYLFMQPLVPVITIEGNWSLSSPLTLSLKPCGHGAIWKLAEQQGVFNWLESHGRTRAIVRQVNNPLAGTDYAILSLIGEGCKKNKSIGFLSCERALNSDEGTNVLIETKTDQGYKYCLTNIEYPEFAHRGIKEIPEAPGSCFSIYPCNTNLLFIDISAIRKVLPTCPIPGQLVNMKSKVSYINSKGEMTEMQGGRLESTMQNIADAIVDHFPNPLNQKQYASALCSFILYNPRSKTISVTKKAYSPNTTPSNTPEYAYYELLSTHYDLLKQCGFQTPQLESFDQYLLKGPSHLFIYHPALGPLYSIIAQKIRKGSFAINSELQLEIIEVDIENLTLCGSLIVHSSFPLGDMENSKILLFKNTPKCTLKNVIIKNKGIDRTTKQCYWKNEIDRKEELRIILGEGAEFHAEGVILEGTHHFTVPPFHRLEIQKSGNNKWRKKLVPIEQATWHWHYYFGLENRITLRRGENHS